MTEIELHRKGLTGTIPSELGSLSGLTVIYLASNDLSGSIPASLGSLTNLRHLNLSYNELRKPLPSELGNLTNLETLHLARNFFLQSLPVSFGNLASLRELNLGATDLLGDIPSQLGNLTNLEELHLSYNRHFNEIPSALGNLTNLRVLRLSGNSLSGAIPASLGNLVNLTQLELERNELSGDIPIRLEELTKLKDLELSYNDDLTGCVPGSFAYVQDNDLFRLGLPYCRAKPIFRTTESGNRSVAENSAEGTSVGTPIAAVDRDGDQLTYSLGGIDSANFSIDTLTGQLRTAVVLNRESQETHALTLSVHDGTDHNGNTDTSNDTTIDVTVTILDVDEAPTITGPGSGTTVEHADVVLGFYSATDPEHDDIDWSVGGVDRAAFRIDEHGALRFAVPPDYESPTDRGSDNSYDLVVQASDESNTVSHPVVVTVTEIEEAPVLVGRRAASLAENSSGEIGRYQATDPEGLAVSLTLGGPDAGSLTLSDDGVLSLDTAPDYEAPDDANQDRVYEVTVEASDGTLQTSRQVRIAVRDVNEAPTVTGDTDIERDEIFTDAHTVIGYYNVDDPESADVEWSLRGSDRSDFTIDGSGRLRFAETPDFEYARDSNRNNVYDFRVEASDGDNTSSLAVAVTVSNIDEDPEVRPTKPYPQVGTYVNVRLTDPDRSVTGAQWSWESSSNRSTWSTINSATSNAYRPTSDDVGRYLRASVSYADGEGDNKSGRYTWNSAVRAKPANNTAPSFDSTATAQRSAPQSATSGSAVGLPITATDDDSDPLTYSLSGISNNWFRIDAATGQIRTHVTLDEYPNHSIHLTVTATDPSGLTAQRPVTITVADEADPPVIFGPRVVHVDEGIALRVAYRESDRDGGRPSWSLDGPDREHFEINTYGTLQFSQLPNANEPGDQDRDNTYDVDVEVSDGTFTVTQRVQVIVADLDEPGTVALSNTKPTPGTVLTANLSDPDGDITNVQWEWQRKRSGGQWTPIADTASSTYTVTRGDSGYTLRAEAVYDDAQGPVKSAASAGGKTPSPPTPRDNTRSTSNVQTSVRGPTRSGGGGGGGGGGGASDADRITLFVANGWSPADIGVATALAARTHGSALVYTEAESLSDAVRGLLQIRALDRITLIGGEVIISGSVHTSLGEAKPSAARERITGATRVDTAVRAARMALRDDETGSATLVIANGWSPADVGVASIVAARLPLAAVVYTATDELPAPVLQLIADVKPLNLIVIGGIAAVSPTVESNLRRAAPDASLTRLSGETRTHTAQLAALYLEERGPTLLPGERIVIVTSGWSPPDIGLATVLSARTPGSVVVYSEPDSLGELATELIKRVAPDLVRVIGDKDAVPSSVRTAIEAELPYGGRTQRITGNSRIHTSVNVARSILPRN